MFKILDMTKDNLIAFRVEGRIEKSDYDKINALLKKTEKEHDKVKLYIDLEDIDKIEPKALWEDFKTYFSHIGKVKKVAVVGQGGIGKTFTKLANPFAKAEVKFFLYKETIEARNWIMEEE
ncbi:MAG: STAS/SEC14 domain-containing protein [Bacteroidales bacterium]|nr:STAS/SEC14 domain-containing protein [Bacteroidales bacterium]MCF8346221.1 STAS/SEC14 domain-containing protein [Bacteroidales bacterium]MCF8376630.1 STAS/SEC14 domain-containing protein [Bacteroidales bacterium]MCF8400648.1 STAS/SEC14 domain-containing protein [Bacteroidales bacterium]